MGRHLSPVLYEATPEILMFHCPGCDDIHSIRVNAAGWTWDGNPDRPTFSPSVLIRSGHLSPHFKPGDNCWCAYNAEQKAQGEAPSRFQCVVCHSFVRDGQMEFLGDCTHKLAGQTVPLLPVNP